MNRGSFPILPTRVLLLYSRIEHAPSCHLWWDDLSDELLWQELVKCILSSRVRFETAVDSTERLSEMSVLSLLRKSGGLRPSVTEVSRTLRTPSSRALRLGRASPCYPYYNQRARHIVGAARSLFGMAGPPGLRRLLAGSENAFEARRELVLRIPGLGLKEASHFLRDIGYSDELAILDSHVVRFLEDYLFHREPVSHPRCEQEYLELEENLVNLASECGLHLPDLDSAVWAFMRSGDS